MSVGVRPLPEMQRSNQRFWACHSNLGAFTRNGDRGGKRVTSAGAGVPKISVKIANLPLHVQRNIADGDRESPVSLNKSACIGEHGAHGCIGW